jgi:hypothetical protein
MKKLLLIGLLALSTGCAAPASSYSPEYVKFHASCDFEARQKVKELNLVPQDIAQALAFGVFESRLKSKTYNKCLVRSQYLATRSF